jgi:cysteine-rich repeat protein
MVCGDDLVDVTATDNPCVGTCGGTPASCQAATCGDGKVEIGEACDDGNTIPLDGCEPAICMKSKVLKLAARRRSFVCAMRGRICPLLGR